MKKIFPKSFMVLKILTFKVLSVQANLHFFKNMLPIYNLWMNLSQTWTDYVFGVFFPRL